VILDSGPDHLKRFHATVVVGGEDVATGTGSSKKHAEMAAALSAWTILQAEDDVTKSDLAGTGAAGD
jgi:ribonuclease-3